MNLRRHGCRDLLGILFVAAGTGSGCGTGRAPSPLSLPGPVANAPARSPILLEPPPGASAVSEIAWGGAFAPRTVALRFADGRFAVHRIGAEPSRADSIPTGLPARAIAVVGPDRVATGDASGVALWDSSRAMARPIGRCEFGDVTALIAVEGEGREPALIAGCADGRLVRLRLVRGDKVEVADTIHPDPSDRPVLRLQVLQDHRNFVAIAVDGSARSVHPRLEGGSKSMGRARMFAASPGGALTARLLDGPCVEVVASGDQARPSRYSPPGPVNSLAFARAGSLLVMGADRSLWIASLDRDGQVRPSQVRVIEALRGTVVVAEEPGGSRVAVGDGSGRTELVDGATLQERGQPMSLDDAPDWAFRPAFRFDRPRSGRADPRIEAARRRLDRGEDVAADLRSLESNDALYRASLAELKALTASAESRSGGSTSAISRLLVDAAALFAKARRADREADMEFSLGALLARPLERSPEGRDPRSSPDAIGPLRRAATLYRKASPPLDRQAHLCDALRAWVLLDLGDVAGATRTLAPVGEAARADSVLGRVVELDRIAAALAAARRDWSRSAAADALVLKRLADDERPELAREAALSRAGALAAIGDWGAAAETLRRDRPDDAAWSIRRAVCRQRSKLDLDPHRSTGEDDPVAAHLRAITTATTAAERLSDLTIAAQGHHLAGRDDLALEAELGRAECLERIGHRAEAASAYAAVARGVAAIGPDPARRASRPVLDEGLRAARGVARCELAAGRPLRALAALEEAGSPAWAAEPGAALGLAASEFPLAEALRQARARLEALGGEGASPEADSATLDVHRARISLAGQTRGPRPGDAAFALGTAALGLAEDEALLAFARIGPRSLLAVLARGKGEVEARVLALSPTELAREITDWRATLTDARRSVAPERRDTPAAILGLPDEPDAPASKSPVAPGGPVQDRLHRTLFAPFLARLEGVKTLYVVPGAGLAAMPLEVLARADGPGGTLSFRSLPRAAVLSIARDEARAERPSELTALLVSPEAGESARAWAVASRASGWTVAGLLADDARPDRVLGDSLARYKAVHITSGATLDPVRSASGDSEIALRPSPWAAFGDGLLSSRNLSRIPLRASVLVLEVHDPLGATGAGLLDLADAGLATGAEGVLLTLWKHPEPSSRLFFATFYETLAARRSPAEATAFARSAVARDPRFRDPVHWAGYAYYGP